MTRRKLVLAVLAAGLVGLVVVPVLLARFSERPRRDMEWVRLEDTRHEEITFRNQSQDLQLSGMLFVPQGEGPFPAAVIIHGSGTSHRASGWYLTLAHSLQQNGIAVLLPDKRGSEQSEGDWRTASFQDLATDTLAAVSFLKSQDHLAISHVGVIGLSQGGHIAPVVAAQAQDLAFLVSIVGGAVPMHDLLVYEETHNLLEMGFLPGIAHLLAYPSSWMVRRFIQDEFWNAIGNFDPIPSWRRVSIPSLVLYGADDTNVPSRQSASILRSLGKPNIDVRIYEGSGHALESPPGLGNSIFRDDALRDIRNFVLDATAGPEGRP